MILMGFNVYILQCMYLLYRDLHLLCFVRKWRNKDDQLQSDSPSHCIMTPQSFRNNWFALQIDFPFWIDSQ